MILSRVSCNNDFPKAIEEAYEQELHQAILLSKLAYEEQLVSTAKNEKDQEQIKKSGKKSKKATMSLVEFNSLSSSNIVPSPILPSESVDNKSKGNDLYNEVMSLSGNEWKKYSIKRNRKYLSDTFSDSCRNRCRVF